MTPEDASSRAPAEEGASPASGEGPGAFGRLRWILLLVLLLGVADLSRPPEDQLSAAALLTGIDLYQATLSSRLPEVGVSCRFRPTCSRYAEAVIRRDGALVGLLEATARIARCGPWTPHGTHDPP